MDSATADRCLEILEKHQLKEAVPGLFVDSNTDTSQPACGAGCGSGSDFI